MKAAAAVEGESGAKQGDGVERKEGQQRGDEEGSVTLPSAMQQAVTKPNVTQAEAELMPLGDSIEALTGELNVLKREVQQMLWKRKLETPRAVAALKSAGWTVSQSNDYIHCTVHQFMRQDRFFCLPAE